MTAITHYTIVLHTIDVRLTGLQFRGSTLFPFLKIGTTNAFVQYSGIDPSLRSFENISQQIGLN